MKGKQMMKDIEARARRLATNTLDWVTEDGSYVRVAFFAEGERYPVIQFTWNEPDWQQDWLVVDSSVVMTTGYRPTLEAIARAAEFIRRWDRGECQ